jgi:hypothetical protein
MHKIAYVHDQYFIFLYNLLAFTKKDGETSDFFNQSDSL